MFEFFKKRKKLLSADELSQMTAMACTEVRDKWIHFHNTVHLSDEVSLEQKIDFFSQPLSEFFRKKYPQMLLGGSELFWLTTFTAILESGTHSKEQVNAAIDALQGKYGGKI